MKRTDITIQKLRILFTDIACLMASKPAKLRLTVTPSEDGFCAIRILPDASDMPRLIGRAGANVSALRTLAEMVAHNHGCRAGVFIVEPAERKESQPFVAPDPKWNPEPVRKAALAILEAAGRKGGDMLYVPDRHGANRFVLTARLSAGELQAFGQIISAMAKQQGSGPITIDVPSGTTV